MKNVVPPCESCETISGSAFCVLKKQELELLTHNKTHFNFKKGQSIFYENGNVQGIYCIYSGKVIIHKHSDDREQIVRLAKPGSWIGYRALLSGEKYAASATAIENTTVCFIPVQVFIGTLKDNSSLAFKAMRLLAQNLGESESLLTSMVHKQASGKVAESLLTLIDFYGYEEDGVTINAPFSRENLAAISGITTETAIRILSVFNKKKFVKLQGKKIRILDVQKLTELSDL